MGWTSYYARNYKNGKVDVIAEVEEELNCENEKGKWTVLKSAKYGSTVYSAVEYLNKETNEKKVFATVFLTSTRNGEFAYKDMDETCGPYQYDCPESILKLLTPTESKWANEWRAKCREYRKKAKELKALPMGSKIIIKEDNDEDVILEKRYSMQKNGERWYVEGTYTYYKDKTILARGWSVK